MCLHNGLDKCVYFLGNADVRLKKHRGAAGLFYRCHDLCAGIRTPGCNGDMRPGISKRINHCPTDPGCAAGDENDAVVE